MRADVSTMGRYDGQIKTKIWSEEEFSSSRRQWDLLVSEATADSLFMSWDWLYHWWRLRRIDQSQLLIIACYDNDQLVGIAPFYIEAGQYLRGMLKFNRLQMLGSRFAGGSGVRCEYNCVIARKNFESEVVNSIVQVLKQEKTWSEIVLSDFSQNLSVNQSFYSALSDLCRYRREDHSGTTYWVDTNEEFESYIGNLGKNSRLKLYNRRKLLDSMGQVSLVGLDGSNFKPAIDIINKWHLDRWGRPSFSEKDIQFLIDVTEENNRATIEHSSILMLDDKPLSVMINLTCNGCIYNIQLGYVEDFDKRIALGTLHIGYVVEKAFLDESIHRIDFLEGSGKRSNYKSRIAQEGEWLQSSRYFSSMRLSLMFLFYDRFIRH